MTGGLGADTFEFRRGDDQDVITDYVPGSTPAARRRLWVSSFGVLTAAQVVATFATDTGPDILLDFGAGQSLNLLGVATIANLDLDITII
jgi:hypothetical protein